MIRIRSILAAVSLAAAAACGPAEPEFFGTTLAGGKAAASFALTDQHGEAFRLADQRGKVVLLFFGYAHCPDVCPVTLSNWVRAQEALAGVDGVEFVFVTVDPERDTAERLREHLAVFSERFHGLTGSLEQLEPVYRDYGIFRRKVPFSHSAVGYVVDHSTVMMLLDRQGRIRVTFPFDADPDQIVHDVRRLLEEAAPAGPSIRIADAWSRPTAGSSPGVVYFSIVNSGSGPDRLVGVRSACCGALEIHRSSMQDGHMSMAPVEGGLVVEAGATVALEPGGYHLMLFEPKETRAGESFELTLEFEHGGEIPVAVAVR